MIDLMGSDSELRLLEVSDSFSLNVMLHDSDSPKQIEILDLNLGMQMKELEFKISSVTQIS